MTLDAEADELAFMCELRGRVENARKNAWASDAGAWVVFGGMAIRPRSPGDQERNLALRTRDALARKRMWIAHCVTRA